MGEPMIQQTTRQQASISRRLVRAFALATTFVLIAGATSATSPISASSNDTWPQFRGTQASGLAADQEPPTSWNVETGDNVAWKIAIPGLSHSSPIVWSHGDRTTVYVTSAVSKQADASFKHGLYGEGTASDDRSQHRFVLVAVDAQSGEVQWETTLHRGVPLEKRHIKATYANQTPATNGEVIVAFFGSEGLYGVDMEGRILWKAEVGHLDVGAYDAPTYEWGSASSPIIYKDLAIVQCDTQGEDFVLAVDLKTGKQRWRTARDEQPSWGTPTAFPATADHPAVLVANGSNFIVGYDPETGLERWRLGGSSNITTPTPIAAGDDLMVIASGRRPNKPIYVVKRGAKGDLTLPEGKTSSESVVWSSTGKGPYMPTPVVVGERLFVLQNQGILDAYTLSAGEEVYRQRLRHQGGGFSGSPVVAGEMMYLPGEDGDVFVVQTAGEYREIAVNAIGERLMSTPAIANDTLFVKGERHLFAFRKSE